MAKTRNDKWIEEHYGITKPKPFVYIDELRKERDRLINQSDCRFVDIGIREMCKAAAKIARERGKK